MSKVSVAGMNSKDVGSKAREDAKAFAAVAERPGLVGKIFTSSSSSFLF